MMVGVTFRVVVGPTKHRICLSFGLFLRSCGLELVALGCCMC